MLERIQKIIGRVTTKLFPYWCAYCPKRFRRLKSFHNHFLLCEGRKAAARAEEESLKRIAPVNREQRRRMAKKAGQIKDWRKLNAP